jgi:hypothetical protein
MFPPNETEREEIAKQLLGSELPNASTNTAFKAYFDYYDSVVCPFQYGDTFVEVDSPAFQSHADVINYVKSLCNKPALSRDEFLATFLPMRDTMPKEKEYVAGVVTKVAFMVECASKDYYSEGFRGKSDGFRPVKWEGNQRLSDFMEQSFLSERVQTAAQQEKNGEAITRKKALKAWKLTRRYGIKIRATDNLLEHLHYDPRERIVRVFHHTAFLRAHLKRSKNEPLDLDFHESLKLYCHTQIIL